MKFRQLLLAAAMSAASIGPAWSGGLELVMFEEQGCIWCARWTSELGDIYPKTPEGKAAPLRRVDRHQAIPDDLANVRPAFFTPTFVLMQHGEEVGRIEGYPGEDFFWGLLGKMLREDAGVELGGSSG